MVSYHFDETVRQSSLSKAPTSRRVPGCENQGNSTPDDVERRAPNKVHLFQVKMTLSSKFCAVVTLLSMILTPALGSQDQVYYSLEGFLNSFLMEDKLPTTADFENYVNQEDTVETEEDVVKRKTELAKQINTWTADCSYGPPQTLDVLIGMETHDLAEWASVQNTYIEAHKEAYEYRTPPKSTGKVIQKLHQAIDKRRDHARRQRKKTSPVSEDVWARAESKYKANRVLSDHLLESLRNVFTTETEAYCNDLFDQHKLLKNSSSKTIEFLFAQVIRLTKENEKFKQQRRRRNSPRSSPEMAEGSDISDNEPNPHGSDNGSNTASTSDST